MSEMIERVAKAMCDVSWNGDNWEELAEAAIRAMRDGTEEMRIAGEEAYYDNGFADAIWQAMIDAALPEPPGPVMGGGE